MHIMEAVRPSNCWPHQRPGIMELSHKCHPETHLVWPYAAHFLPADTYGGCLPPRHCFWSGPPSTSTAHSSHHAWEAPAATDNITIHVTHTHSCSRLLSWQARYVTHRVWRHMKSSRSPSLSDPVRNQRNLQYSIFQAQKACWIYVI